MKQNYVMQISYDGTRYSGWQSQGNTGNTIQGKLENILKKLTGEDIKVIGAGRTDAGAHAACMVANAHFDIDFSLDEIIKYINNYLPADICINSIKIASERFHSRYNAIGKTYHYTCYIGKSKPVFQRNFVYILDSIPDIDSMKEAAKYLIGRHDFKSFCGNPKFNKSSIRTINSINIEMNDDYIIFKYHGDGFLQNMVRIITGTLLEVGNALRSPQSMPDIINAKNRKEAGFIAPACGLCLIKVDYSSF